MATFFSPEGNPEIWGTKPEGYFTPEEWAEMHPVPEPVPQPFHPGPDYEEQEDGTWLRVRYSVKDFMLWVGFEKIVMANAAIAAGNVMVGAVKDLLMAADFISLKDPDTVQMLGMLATPEGGSILTPEDVARILAGQVVHAEET